LPVSAFEVEMPKIKTQGMKEKRCGYCFIAANDATCETSARARTWRIAHARSRAHPLRFRGIGGEQKAKRKKGQLRILSKPKIAAAKIVG
jgi:hypothetical protein